MPLEMRYPMIKCHDQDGHGAGTLQEYKGSVPDSHINSKKLRYIKLAVLDIQVLILCVISISIKLGVPPGKRGRREEVIK